MAYCRRVRHHVRNLECAAKRQPLAAPRDTHRYFISLREAGQLCLLASVLGPGWHVIVPRLEPALHMCLLEVLAAEVLRHFGLECSIYHDEDRARHNVSWELGKGRYPVLLTNLDTDGEKSVENFIGVGETPCEIGFEAL